MYFCIFVNSLSQNLIDLLIFMPMISQIKTYVYSFICCSLLMISCTSNDELLQNESDFIALQCNKSLPWSSGSGRAVTDENGSGNFSEGDCIELMVASEAEYKILKPEFFAGQWTPPLKRSDFSSNESRLSALFPVLPSDNDTDRTIAVPVDQTTQTSLANTDILHADAVIKPSDSSVSLQFGHALHRICINLKGNVPDNIQLELYSVTDGSISLESGKVTTMENAVRKWIKPFKKDQYTYTAIILPQDATPYHDGEGLIKLSIGDKISSYSLDESITAFNQGMQTTINLTLNSSGTGEIDTEFSNQIRWVYGVKAPDFPGKENIKSFNVGRYEFEEGIWFRYAYENMYPPLPSEIQYLTWKEGCGWYDCNKSFEYIGDKNMCWAAGASNLIHWWMEHNQKYIEAYDKKYGQEYDYARPEKYSKMTEKNQQHSEVFNFFKESFNDKGSWDTGGVNWFINGDRKNISPENYNFEGFFHKVFTTDDKIAVEIKNMSKENFNKTMKDAFKNNKAIGFTSYDFAGKGTGTHALTIWGAEFDAEGNVEYIYFCDNNYSETEPNHASLSRFKVVYVESTIPEIKGAVANLRALDNNDGTIPTLLHPFSGLTIVDLRQDIWKKAFPEVQ